MEHEFRIASVQKDVSVYINRNEQSKHAKTRSNGPYALNMIRINAIESSLTHSICLNAKCVRFNCNSFTLLWTCCIEINDHDSTPLESTHYNSNTFIIIKVYYLSNIFSIWILQPKNRLIVKFTMWIFRLFFAIKRLNNSLNSSH